jgi:hypothetical protein
MHGHFVPPGVSCVGGPLGPPARGHECGKPYPWTFEKIEAAKGLADELENSSDDDRVILKNAIDDVAAGGPNRASGADLTFATHLAANSRSECQIQKLH